MKIDVFGKLSFTALTDISSIITLIIA